MQRGRGESGRGIRLGLCCAFSDAPIRFRTATATALARLPRGEALAKLAALARANAESLGAALQFCADHGIGCFRVNSQIVPLATHPQWRYGLGDLPGGAALVAAFERCGDFARRHGLRTTFHPDQFVVLNSRRPEVVEASLDELEHQAAVAELLGADVVNIHAGGVFGDKAAALDAFARGVDRLSDRARRRLTVENDDRSFSPADLLPRCRSLGVPLVYDVHHHRCLGDGLSVGEASELARATWNREPLFHVSSPLEGWRGPRRQRHHDYIDPDDLPAEWLAWDLTVEVEAKAKELAVLRLARDLAVPRDSRVERIRASAPRAR